MTVCSFFLQGRCRYGEKCWNEHPRGGRSGDYRGNQQQPNRGFGNRVWVNPSQRSGGDYIQPSTFSRGGDWNRSGGSSRDVKSSEFSFSTQNRFSSLSPQRNNDKSGQTSADDKLQQLDTVQKDMEIWQESGQWPFSCYSVLRVQISGFVELSPEELRLEYYTSRASGDLQTYVNSVQQLANQWRTRVQELKSMTSSTQMNVISELNNSSPQTSSHGFGSSSSGFSSASSGFGSSSASSGFGSSSASSGFGSSSASSGFGSSSASSGFGSSSASSGFGTGGFGSASQGSGSFSFTSSGSGFGTSGQQQATGFETARSSSAANFSFTAPTAENKPSTGVFDTASAFSFKSPSSSAGGFGSGFGPSSPTGGFSSTWSGGAAENSGDRLFTAHSDLTAEELREFTGKCFTLGQIPLKPPPADLLVV